MALPLNGIKIIDLTWVLPGPIATLMLADFGAEVIKIEQPGIGDYIRSMQPLVNGVGSGHLQVNRNKKSVVLNLKKPEGTEIFYKLVKKADILIEGFRPGVAERMGIGYEAISKINPGMIYCSVSSYGQDGPYRDLTGHDENYLGLAGVLDMTGLHNGPPVLPAMLMGDAAGGGLMSAIGILLALRSRESTGKGQYIDVAMLDGIIFCNQLFAGAYFATGQSPRRGEVGSLVHLGGYACVNCYRTRDEKYIVAAAMEEKFWSALCHHLGLDDLIRYHLIPNQEIQDKAREELQKVFLTKTRDEWNDELSTIGLPVSSINTLAEALNDRQVLYRKMVVEMEHQTLGTIKQIGIPIKLSDTPGSFIRPAPDFGEHTDEILGDLGYSEEQIKTLRAKGVASG